MAISGIVGREAEVCCGGEKSGKLLASGHSIQSGYCLTALCCVRPCGHNLLLTNEIFENCRRELCPKK